MSRVDVISEELRRNIQTLVGQVCTDFKDEDAIAQNLKRRLDSQLTPTWHVIVGRSYACNVSHEKGTFASFNSGAYNIVVYKAGL